MLAFSAYLLEKDNEPLARIVLPSISTEALANAIEQKKTEQVAAYYSLLEKHVSKEALRDLLAKDDYILFGTAAKHGAIEELDAIVTRLKEFDQLRPALEARECRAFRWAARDGHTEAVDRLSEAAQELGDKKLIETLLLADAFDIAMNNGYYETAQHILDWSDREMGADFATQLVSAGNFGAFTRASDNGRIETVNMLMQLGYERGGTDLLSDMLGHSNIYTSDDEKESLSAILGFLKEKLGEDVDGLRSVLTGTRKDCGVYQRLLNWSTNADQTGSLQELTDKLGGASFVRQALQLEGEDPSRARETLSGMLERNLDPDAMRCVLDFVSSPDEDGAKYRKRLAAAFFASDEDGDNILTCVLRNGDNEERQAMLRLALEEGGVDVVRSALTDNDYLSNRLRCGDYTAIQHLVSSLQENGADGLLDELFKAEKEEILSQTKGYRDVDQIRAYMIMFEGLRDKEEAADGFVKNANKWGGWLARSHQHDELFKGFIEIVHQKGGNGAIEKWARADNYDLIDDLVERAYHGSPEKYNAFAALVVGMGAPSLAKDILTCHDSEYTKRRIIGDSDATGALPAIFDLCIAAGDASVTEYLLKYSGFRFINSALRGTHSGDQLPELVTKTLNWFAARGDRDLAKSLLRETSGSLVDNIVSGNASRESVEALFKLYEVAETKLEPSIRSAFRACMKAAVFGRQRLRKMMQRSADEEDGNTPLKKIMENVLTRGFLGSVRHGQSDVAEAILHFAEMHEDKGWLKKLFGENGHRALADAAGTSVEQIDLVVARVQKVGGDKLVTKLLADEDYEILWDNRFDKTRFAHILSLVEKTGGSAALGNLLKTHDYRSLEHVASNNGEELGLLLAEAAHKAGDEKAQTILRERMQSAYEPKMQAEDTAPTPTEETPHPETILHEAQGVASGLTHPTSSNWRDKPYNPLHAEDYNQAIAGHQSREPLMWISNNKKSVKALRELTNQIERHINRSIVADDFCKVNSQDSNSFKYSGELPGGLATVLSYLLEKRSVFSIKALTTECLHGNSPLDKIIQLGLEETFFNPTYWQLSPETLMILKDEDPRFVNIIEDTLRKIEEIPPTERVAPIGDTSSYQEWRARQKAFEKFETLASMDTDSGEALRKLVSENGFALLNDIPSKVLDPQKFAALIDGISSQCGTAFVGEMLQANDGRFAISILQSSAPERLQTLLSAAKDLEDGKLVKDVVAKNEYALLKKTIARDDAPQFLALMSYIPLQERAAVMDLMPADNDLVAKEQAERVRDLSFLPDQGDEVRKLVSKADFALFRRISQQDDVKELKTFMKAVSTACGPDFVGEMVRHDDFDIVYDVLDDKPSTHLDAILSSIKGIDNGALVREFVMRDECRALKEAADGDMNNEFAVLMSVLPKEDHRAALEQLPPEHRNVAGKSKHEIWQEVGRGEERWVALTGKEAPSGYLADKSPYNFSFSAYQKLMPLMELVLQAGGRSVHPGADIYAYKLSTLFSNVAEVDRYLKKSNGGTAVPLQQMYGVLAEACKFDVPQNGVWDRNKWKGLAHKYGTKIATAFKHAPSIERMLADCDKPFPESLSEINKMSAIAQYKRSMEAPEFARNALRCDLNESTFNKVLDAMKTDSKTQDYLPRVFIDGADMGHPNYYMTKLDVTDPTGYILGTITNCCQHINGAGSSCAKHGMTSRWGGFYVWKQKTNGQVTDDDQIVAQSWAWVAKDGKIVFDSFEKLSDGYNHLCQPFMEEYAHQVIGKFFYKSNGKLSHVKKPYVGVNLGCHGSAGTPRDLTFETFSPKDVKKDFLDGYDKYSDANTQFIVKPLQHIFSATEQAAKKEAALQAQTAAKTYLEETLRRFDEEYGIVVKTGMELECYALDRNGSSRGGLLDPAKVEAKLKREGIVQRFADENTQDYYGQYEAIVGVFDPLETAYRSTAARDYMSDNAERLGVHGFSFAPLPFVDKEASSAHISFSLWTKDGKPLFADAETGIMPLMRQVARGLLETQKSTAILYAQTEEAYGRYGNTEWSPRRVGLATSGNEGTSLRFAMQDDYAFQTAVTDPAKVRIEDRLSASDSDYYVAMAATVVGIDNALRKYVKTFEKDALPPDIVDGERHSIVQTGEKTLVVNKFGMDSMPMADLPGSRQEALKLLEIGIDRNLGTIPNAKPLFEAVVNMHKPSTLTPTPQQGTDGRPCARGAMAAVAAAFLAIVTSAGMMDAFGTNASQMTVRAPSADTIVSTVVPQGRRAQTSYYMHARV